VRHRRLVDRDFGWPGEIWTAVIFPQASLPAGGNAHSGEGGVNDGLVEEDVTDDLVTLGRGDPPSSGGAASLVRP